MVVKTSAVPKPALLVSPAQSAQGINSASTFQWSETGVLNLVSISNGSHWLCVITARNDAAIPTCAFDAPFSLPLETTLSWSVIITARSRTRTPPPRAVS